MTKPPNSLEIGMYVQCDECSTEIEVGATIGKPTEGTNALRDLLDKNGWQPLMIGKTAVGVNCRSCANEKLGIEDENGDKIDAEEATSEENVEAFPKKTGNSKGK